MNQVIEGVGKDAPTVSNEQGGKQSQVLYRFDLLDPKAMFEMTKVLEAGARKYGDDNWRKISVQDHLNHLLIHVYAYLAGDTSDDHLSHIMCRSMFAQAIAIQDPKVDRVRELWKENMELAAELSETKEKLQMVWRFAKDLENSKPDHLDIGVENCERDNKIIDQAVSLFAEEMKKKLYANAHKSHWIYCDTNYLLKRLNDEFQELFEAINKGMTADEIIQECADVANFAMFIADNMNRLKQ